MPDLLPLEVKVWGEFALYTRPETKVERVSYPVMTPSAARGLLESILWKPQMAWQVREIWVLSPIRYFSILRNEVNTRQSERAARGWLATGRGGYLTTEDRAQRHTLALRDVAYRIRADIIVQPGVNDDVAKYRDQFRRRVARGQAHHPPYLGCREFTANFQPPQPTDQPIDLTEDLGRMLFDIRYSIDGPGHGQPRFFEARLESGVLRVPAMLYEEI